MPVSRALIRTQSYLVSVNHLMSYMKGLESMSHIAKALVATVVAGVVVTGMAGVASADTHAGGAAVGSPGIDSGNNVQMPIHIPINVCGNSVNHFTLLNPAFRNTCINSDVKTHGYYHDEHRRR